MASILQFGKRPAPAPIDSVGVSDFIDGFSIEVMPRTAAAIEDFREILPQGTRVYVAHIDGTPIEDMLTTASRLMREGFAVMPHFPARIIADRSTLETWIKSYADLGIRQALLLGGGVDRPAGDFDNSMQLLETGLFDDAGFTDLHIAGHPEGNKDIDPNGGDKNVMAALRWKADFASRTDARMAIATQFCFEAEPVIAWAEQLRKSGITLPIHIGIAGPAKLQTMIKFAMACGVGPSIRVLQRRAKDLSKLMMPFTPHDVLSQLSTYKKAHPEFQVEKVHFFPLGGITKTAEFASQFGQGGASGTAASA